MYLSGVYTALITPFHQDEVDVQGVRNLIRRQIEAGVDGILLLGTTAETPTLTSLEREEIVRVGIEECKNKVTTVVGVSSNCTRTTIERALWAQKEGADALLISAPYYNKPTQRGIYQHFEAISKEVDTPIVIYNIPSRTGVPIDPLTLYEIAELPNVVSVKEASGNIPQIGDILHHRRDHTPPFTVLSGDDVNTLPIMALGGHGVFSVVSNLVPEKVVAMVRALDECDLERARDLHFELLPLFKGCSLETNPIPIKEAMQACDLPAGSCRLPLCEMSEPHRVSLHGILQNSGLLPIEA